MPPKRTYSLSEAAKKLGISRTAVYAAIKSGRLKARHKVIKLRAWIIDSVDLKEYHVSESHQQRGKNFS